MRKALVLMLLALAAPLAACDACDPACSPAPAVDDSLSADQGVAMLSEAFRALPLLAGDSAERRAGFQAQCDAAAAELKAVHSSKDFAELQARAEGVMIARFNRDTDPDSGESIFFKSQGDKRIRIDASLPDPVKAQYCSTAAALSHVLIRYGATARDRVDKALDASITRWQNFHSYGYSQFPHELYLNGLHATRLSLDPPQHQVIVLHPSYAMEFSGPSWNQLRRHDVLALEAFGYLGYTEDRRSYFGLSLAALVPSDDNIGVGALIHWGSMFELGYALRTHSGNRWSEGSVVMSVDLYGLLGNSTAAVDTAVSRLKALK